MVDDTSGVITDVGSMFSELDVGSGVFTDVVTKPFVRVETLVVVVTRFDSVLDSCVGNSVEN